MYSLNNEYLCSFESLTDASKITGTNRCSISQVCKGKRKTAGGYLWKFS